MTDMTERVAYVNGKFVPEDQASISIFDRGLRWGDAIYDVERTFHHQPFELDLHLERISRTLRYTRIRAPMPIREMKEAITELARRNSRFYDENDDFEICQIITRGTIQQPNQPNFAMYCQDFDWQLLGEQHKRGVRLVTASHRRVPAQALSPNAKISNKMHLFIASEEVKAADPQALALILDTEGRVAEACSHNIFFVARGALHTPSLANCLPGISRAVTLRLAREAGIPVAEGEYRPFDLCQAEEAFLTATGYCMVGVTHIDGVAIGDGYPGPVSRRLIEAWNRLVGLDFAAQAKARATVRA